MMYDHIHRQIERLERQTRKENINKVLQISEKPTLSELVASGEYTEPQPLADFLKTLLEKEG